MPDGPKLSAGDFGAAFKGFLEEAVTTAPAPDPFFRARLTAHFGVVPTSLPVVAEQFPAHDHPNLQLALDDEVAGTGGATALLGVAAESRRMMGMGLGDLVAAARPGLLGGGPVQEGPVEWINRPSGHDEVLPCVQFGLYLFPAGREDGAAGAGPLALLVRGADQRNYMAQNVNVEAMAGERATAERFLSRLRHRMRQRNVYRGRIVSLSQPNMGPLEVRFHQVPTVGRDGIVLPDGVLERIERQTIRFARLRERLLRAGRHLKRGVLLWGPPGTGKTLTAMYLARQMPDRTVLLLTGKTLGLIATSCTMARLLQPATVILEDVDLVAEERTHQSTGTNTVLFELLNQMDGLGDDADVLFVLTSNRPELLEPALAARPGRVDEAIEIPLPDAGCRARLLALYGEGLDLRLTDPDAVVGRTEGVSAAFIKELLRKAAVFAAESSGPDHSSAGDGITVTDEHIDQALLDLMVEGGRLTRSLLGVNPGRGVRPDCG